MSIERLRQSLGSDVAPCQEHICYVVNNIKSEINHSISLFILKTNQIISAYNIHTSSVVLIICTQLQSENIDIPLDSFKRDINIILNLTILPSLVVNN